MSAPVDVLADLAELIARDEEQQDYCSEPCANEAMGRVVKLQAIRAAVAELIEAAKGVAEMEHEPRFLYGEIESLRAALAKVGAA